MVFCHGLSEFNAPLTSALQNAAMDLIRCLEPGGSFIFSWSSNLRGGKRKRQWTEHNLHDVEQFLESLTLKVEATCFLDRRILLRLFGQRAFNPIITRLSSFVSRVLGSPGLIVCIARQPVPLSLKSNVLKDANRSREG